MIAKMLMDRSRDEIRDVQERLLRAMVAMCGQRHPYYKRCFARAGLAPEQIRSLDDLPLIPLTDKREFIADPEAFRLDCSGLSAVERTLWDVAYTTGTTGQPTPFYSNTHDFYGLVTVGRNMCAIRGIGANDTVLNLFPLPQQPAGAFLRVQTAAMGVGFAVGFALPGRVASDFDVHRSLDQVAEWVSAKRGTVLWGVASYIRRLAMRASELGVSWPAVRYLAVSGEPITPGLRQDLREKLATVGAADVVIGNSLGMTEIQGGLVECAEGSGFHNPAPELYHFDIVDADSGRSLPDEERGLLCLTHLNRRGTVLLRYLIGDIVSRTSDPCPSCGRQGERLVTNPTRTAHLYKVKATLIDPGQISAEIERIAGILEHRIVITKERLDDPYSADDLVVQLAGPAAAADVTSSRVISHVRELFGVTPRIEVVNADSIYEPGSSMKSVRVIDVRPRWNETGKTSVSGEAGASGGAAQTRTR